MKFYLILFVFIGILSCQGVIESKYSTLILKGSESMHETFDALASDFEKLQDSIDVVIEGGGSRTGLMAIKNHTADIGLSSYSFDIDSVLGYNHKITDKIIAYDGIVIVNNELNPLDRLTKNQISAIYTGVVSDWSELGGEPGHILPIVRDSNSGTQRFFADYFNVVELAPSAIEARENHQIVNTVFENRNSIGFIGYAYFTHIVKHVSIPSNADFKDSVRFVSPSPTNIENGLYPLKRSLHLYYRKDDDLRVTAFLKYLNSERAKLIIENNGLVPL